MQAKETLNFRIGLSGTYWDKKSKFSVLVDDAVMSSGEITSSETQYIEFTAELEDDASHVLKIRLENKTDADVVQNEDKTEIVKDMLLNIVSIEIDDIDLGQLLWSMSKFVGDDPARPIKEKCVNLGWNGAYTLEFNCPFYLWLLESL